MIVDKETGAMVRVFGMRSSRRMHGAAPKLLLLLDELAQWPTDQNSGILGGAPNDVQGQNP